MLSSGKTLFQPVVDSDKLNENFKLISTAAANDPSRRMLDEIYHYFEDPDGNFIEQFQTTGFDARFFELYLFAYFTRSGFSVNRTHPNPDFIVSQGDVTVAVEATTVNPSVSGTLASEGKNVKELTQEELKEYISNELAIRFGSPLYSKLQKKYWELEHCKDLPFVIAIEAFHDEESLIFSNLALTQYLYGLTHSAGWDQSGILNINHISIKEHKVGEKVISSNFFSQPDAKHISAIVFSNSGTNAKFARMGYQHGYGCNVISMRRDGYCLNPDPDAMDATFFSYNLDEPPSVEPWGQGLVVLHNPNCLHPISKGFFVNALELHLTKEEKLKAEYTDWHPFASKTFIIYMGEAKQKLLEAFPRFPCIAVGAIPKEEFHAIGEYRFKPNERVGGECGWYSDEYNSFLGVLIKDKIDSDWGYIILARNEHFHFCAIDTTFDFSSRELARDALQQKMFEYLSRPKRIFSQGHTDPANI